MVAAVLDQPVNLVQKGRHLLDFVYDHLPGGAGWLGFEFLAKQLGP